MQVKKDGERATGGVELNDSFFKGLTDFLQLYSQKGNSLEKMQLDLERRLHALETKLTANASNLCKLRVSQNSTSEVK